MELTIDGVVRDYKLLSIGPLDAFESDDPLVGTVITGKVMSRVDDFKDTVWNTIDSDKGFLYQAELEEVVSE